MLPKLTEKQADDLKVQLTPSMVIMSGPANEGMSSSMAIAMRESRKHYLGVSTGASRPLMPHRPEKTRAATGLLAGLLRRIR